MFQRPALLIQVQESKNSLKCTLPKTFGQVCSPLLHCLATHNDAATFQHIKPSFQFCGLIRIGVYSRGLTNVSDKLILRYVI